MLGFAYLGAAFSFSRLVASLIGGLAAGYDLPFGILKGNPYALPSFIGTLFNAASFIMAVLFIPETLSQAQKANAKKNPTVHTEAISELRTDAMQALVEGVKYIASDSILRNLILGFALNSVTNGILTSIRLALLALTGLIL